MAGIFLTKYSMEYPTQISLRNYIQYLPSQERVDCCTSSSVLLAAEILLSQSGKNVHFSRLYLYYMTRKLQGRLGQRGAELSATFEALKRNGVATDRMWPFTSSRVEMHPHSPAVEEAVYHKLDSFEQIEVSQYKEYLNRGIPIVIGMFTGRRFWSLRGALEVQKYIPVGDEDNHRSKGHAIVCIGYNDHINNGSWIIANSLGPTWGYQGYGAIPYSCNQDFAESYVITSFSGISAGKKISEN